jgi:hypothetical protein
VREIDQEKLQNQLQGKTKRQTAGKVAKKVRIVYQAKENSHLGQQKLNRKEQKCF